MRQGPKPDDSNSKDSGFILLVILWIMVMLSVMAISLSRRVSMELSLTRYTIAKLKADALARAGVVYSMDLIREDTQDKQEALVDTMAACGIKLEEGKTAENMLRRVELGTGYFDVGYLSGDNGLEGEDVIYGFQDEERRININAVTHRTKGAFEHLLMLSGASLEEARMVAAAVIDWHDEDHDPADPIYGAESAEYETLPHSYRCKNRSFESIQELLLVKGISKDMFDKLKRYVTVFPLKTPDLVVNLATSSEIVIRAVARSVVDLSGNKDPEDADSLARKIVSFRRGPDGREGTADDRRIRFNDMALNANEKSLFLMMTPLTTEVSNYFRIRVKGVETTLSVESVIEVVIERDSLSVVCWREGRET